MKVQYTIRLEAELLERAKRAAENEMRSLNNLIEYAIKRYLDGGNEAFIQGLREGYGEGV